MCRPSGERAGLLGLLVGDHAVRLHLAEDQVAAAQGLLRIEQRRIGDGALGQAGQQRGLGQVQIFGVLGEVELRCGLEAVHAAAEINLVAVEREDLLLGEGALDLDGEIGFLHLAGGGAIGGEKKIARQLHGQRGSALGAAVGAEIVPERAGDAEDVDAPVRFEVLVFDGDDGLAQDGREVVVVDDDAALQSKGADDAALAVVEIGRGGGPVALEVVDLRQIDGVDQGEAGQRTGDDGEKQEHREGELCRQACADETRVAEPAQGAADGSGQGRACSTRLCRGAAKEQASLAFLLLQRDQERTGMPSVQG